MFMTEKKENMGPKIHLPQEKRGQSETQLSALSLIDFVIMAVERPQMRLEIHGREFNTTHTTI